MRNHGKDNKDEQLPGPRRPRLPALAKAKADQDEFQALFAFAYLQTQNLRKQAVEELKQDADAISAVIETQHALAVSDFDLQGKLDYIIEQARKITNAGGAVIALADGGQIVCRARTGLIGPPLGSCLDPHNGISGECIRTGELLYCDDTETDPRVNLEACRQLGIRSILAFPLILHEETLGLVEIFSGWAGVFGDRDSRTMKMLAGQIIEALWEEETPIVAARGGAAAVDEAEAKEEQAGHVDEIEAASPAPEPFTVAIAHAERSAAPSPFASGGAAAAAAPALKASAMVEAPAVVQPAAAVAFDFLKSEEEPKLFTPKVMIAVVLVVLLLAILVWEHWAPHAIPPPSVIEMSRLQPPSEPQPTVTPVPVGQAHLTEIKHWSKKDYTSIAVFLDGTTKYESAALHDPERIYFDLQDTGMREDYPKKKEMVVEVNDRFVSRIRAAQKDGRTRVVLDLKEPAEYNTVLSSDSPYRLMISVHPRGTKAGSLDIPAPEAAKPSVKDSATPAVTAPTPELHSADATATIAPKRKLRIVIDPGHGGTEDGAIGRNGLKEKDLVLDVAHRLGTLLAMKLDAEIFYTRTDDRNVALEERTEYANQLQADMFVSVHANSSLDPNARGIETYYMDSAASMHEAEVAARENATSKKKVGNMLRAHLAMPEKIERSHKLANMVQQALYTSLADGQLKNRGVKRAPFVVLLGADMPAVLAEISFLSSPDDERALEGPDLRDRVADALYRGIAKYLAGSKQEKQYVRSAALAGK